MLARLAQMAAVVATVAILCFGAQMLLPGDKAVQVAVARSGEAVGEAAIARAQADGGFGRSVPAQFASWMGRLVSGDMGVSLISRRPVAEALAQRLPVTLKIGVMSVLLGLLLGIPPGVGAGLRPGGVLDAGVAAAAALFSALPSFLVGLVLVAFFAVRLGWLPSAGSATMGHLVLPALTLALPFAAGLARIARHAVRRSWSAFPVVFGRLKGLSPVSAGLRHGVRNAAVPVVVATGLRLAAVLEGFVVVETLFNVPGLGDLLVHAVLARDIPMMQGVAVVFGVIYGLAGLLIDLACAALDPRLRLRAA